MASQAQINANRANALKSTGPRSAEGKSNSRFNALKHGIDAASIVIPGEDPADYDALVAAYHRDFRPESPSETFHVDTMLRADWQKRRLQRVEADLHRTLLAETPGASLAAALLSDSPAATLLAQNWLRSRFHKHHPTRPQIHPRLAAHRRKNRPAFVLCRLISMRGAASLRDFVRDVQGRTDNLPSHRICFGRKRPQFDMVKPEDCSTV